MPTTSLFKFVNWITGTPTPIEDGVASAFTSPLQTLISNLFIGSGTLAPLAIGMQFNCYLSLSAPNLILNRVNGTLIFINGQHYTIPGAGVTLGVGGLSASTFYYIYAFINGTTLTLEASTTAYATDTTYGHKIKSGDGTRTLVGAAITTAGTAWVDNTTGTIGIISWHNRRKKVSRTTFSTGRSLVDPLTFTEFNTEIRNTYICWAEENVFGAFSATGCNASTISANAYAATLDGNAVGLAEVDLTERTAGDSIGGASPFIISGATENVSHFVTFCGSISGPGTLTAGVKSAIAIELRG